MDGFIVKQPFGHWIIEGKKEWELRSRAPPKEKIKKDILLLSSGYALGKIMITDYWEANKDALIKNILKHKSETNILDDNYISNVWEIDVIEKFSAPKKYVHPAGARIWVKNVSFNHQEEISNFF